MSHTLAHADDDEPFRARPPVMPPAARYAQELIAPRCDLRRRRRLITRLRADHQRMVAVARDCAPIMREQAQLSSPAALDAAIHGCVADHPALVAGWDLLVHISSVCVATDDAVVHADIDAATPGRSIRNGQLLLPLTYACADRIAAAPRAELSHMRKYRGTVGSVTYGSPDLPMTGVAARRPYSLEEVRNGPGMPAQRHSIISLPREFHLSETMADALVTALAVARGVPISDCYSGLHLAGSWPGVDNDHCHIFAAQRRGNFACTSLNAFAADRVMLAAIDAINGKDAHLPRYVAGAGPIAKRGYLATRIGLPTRSAMENVYGPLGRSHALRTLDIEPSIQERDYPTLRACAEVLADLPMPVSRLFVRHFAAKTQAWQARNRALNRILEALLDNQRLESADEFERNVCLPKNGGLRSHWASFCAAVAEHGRPSSAEMRAFVSAALAGVDEVCGTTDYLANKRYGRHC